MKTIAFTAAALATTLVAGAASAQAAPPMGMNWAFASQAQNQRMSDLMVRQAFNQTYRTLKRMRREGHPFNGVIMARNNPNTFGDGGYAARDQARSRALWDHNLRAVRGCARVVQSRWGDRGYVCS